MIGSFTRYIPEIRGSFDKMKKLKFVGVMNSHNCAEGEVW